MPLEHYAGASNTFLPGGHIKLGEKATDCLARELREEINSQDVEVGRFLGAVEHRWQESGVQHYEINLLFDLRLRGIAPLIPPQSREERLNFFWASPNELTKHNLKPSPLIDYICKHIEDRAAFWGSTL